MEHCGVTYHGSDFLGAAVQGEETDGPIKKAKSKDAGTPIRPNSGIIFDTRESKLLGSRQYAKDLLKVKPYRYIVLASPNQPLCRIKTCRIRVRLIDRIWHPPFQSKF